MSMRSVALVGLAVAAGACQKKATPAAGPNVVNITATDYAFAAPDTIPAGLTTFKMVNAGKEPHQAVIMGSGDHSFQELEAGTMAEGPIPAWLVFPAGVAMIIPGDTGNATAQMAPGNYLLVCYIPSPDGKPHILKGMIRRLVVAPAPAGAAAATEPATDLTVTLADYSFAFSTPLTAGTHTIRVENAGPQVHEISIDQLGPGKTLADWQQFVQHGMKGAPPSRPMGGFIGPSVGGHGSFTMTFVPGKYVLYCFVPDAKDGKPHVMHGMVQEITVN